MAGEPVGGTIFLTVNGTRRKAKGSFTYNLGREKRETIVGADAVHGFKSMQQPAFIAGEITDESGLKLEELVSAVDVTAVLQLANGKTISLRNAWFVEEGTGNTEEGNIAVRWESDIGDEL